MTARNRRNALLGVTAFGLLLGSCGRDEWKTTDKVTISSEQHSPDGKFIATVYDCAGGGAAGYSYTNINLRKATEPFNQRDFLLGQHLWKSFKDIEVRWKDGNHLEVSYAWQSDNPDHKERNQNTVAEKDGVTINYTLK